MRVMGRARPGGASSDDAASLRIQDLADAFQDRVLELMLSGDPRVEHLGSWYEAHDFIARRAVDVRHSLWNMQSRIGASGQREGQRIAESITMPPDVRMVVPPAVVHRSPLIGPLNPWLRVGWVPLAFMITDGKHAFLAGFRGTATADTIWESRDPAIIAEGERLFTAVHDASRPWEEVSPYGPLPERRLAVARLLCDGANDREIAEALGASTRTVSAEVRAVVEWVGARSRTHAIALLSANG